YNLPLNPTPQTLARFISWTSLTILSGPKYLSGVRHYLRDLYPDFDDNRAHPLVRATIRGSKKARADPVRRKLPLHPSHLDRFVTRAKVTNAYDDWLFATILSCAFYACHRSGELVVNNDHRLLDWRKLIKRGSLVLTDDHAGYRLPYHKGDPFYRGSDVVVSDWACASPVGLLKHYTKLRNARHRFHPALFIRENGTLPNKSWFDKRLHDLLGMDYGGHSARAGAATWLAGLGVDLILHRLDSTR
ncbi:hypothetical protein BKA70DRAFT_1122185, partial [Coprinopsis sp. MPI-PUGE-AT-0042]